MNSSVIRVNVASVAVCGPGLPDWESSRPVLSGHQVYRPAPIVLQPPARLSAAERRRAVPSVRLALGVGTACIAQSSPDPSLDQTLHPSFDPGLDRVRDPDLDPGNLPAVFASSGADGETIVAILAALATAGREVSPTRFHNSVHNAPSGYWGIAMQSREAVTSVSCHDASFAAGLLEAGVQAVAAGRPVLLVAYDLAYPEPLDQVRHIEAGFGVAFLLRPASAAAADRAPSRTPPPGRALAELGMRITSGGAAEGCAEPALEALRRGNPAARSLPLLVMLANRSAGRVHLDLSHGSLEVEVAPC